MIPQKMARQGERCVYMFVIMVIIVIATFVLDRVLSHPWAHPLKESFHAAIQTLLVWLEKTVTEFKKKASWIVGSVYLLEAIAIYFRLEYLGPEFRALFPLLLGTSHILLTKREG
jgi:hypothetical protein